MTLKRAFNLTLISIAVFIGLLIVAANVRPTKALVPLLFGGPVILETICDEGILLQIGTPGPPGFYMLTHVSARLTPSLLVPHIGQFLLGISEAIPVPCTIDEVSYGAGLPILMAGGSL
jgi:hypothetical protein